jgi:hypothetical protein
MNTPSKDHSDRQNKQPPNNLDAMVFPLFIKTRIKETTKLNSPAKLNRIISAWVFCIITLKLDARYPAVLKTFVEQILQQGIYE